MTDILFIERLIAMVHIGVCDWEKKCLQKLIFDLQLSYSTESSLKKEAAEYYINYTHVSQMTLDLVSGKHFFLIEDVAHLIANTLIRRFCLCFIRVKVSKPGAIYGASNVGICIERRK